MTLKLSQKNVAFLGLCVLLLILDQVSKDWALSHWSIESNAGVAGGFLQELDPRIGRIFFSVFGSFLAIFAGFLLFFLKPKQAPGLKLSIGLLTTGFLGNIVDRTLRGHVIDFIPLHTGSGSMLVVNGADLLIGLALLLLGVSLYRERQAIWFEQNLRRRVVIDPHFQFQYTFLLLALSVLQGVIISVYSFAFLSVYLGHGSETGRVGEAVLGESTVRTTRILHDYLWGLGILEACCLIFVAVLGVLFSHRAAGPLYAFELFIQRWLKGDQGLEKEIFRLRTTDHFKSLERIAELIRNNQNPVE